MANVKRKSSLMPSPAVAHLEAALRARNLDRTLTSSLHRRDRSTPVELAPTQVPAFDLPLHGGWPRGEVSEIVGAVTSGRTTVVRHTLAAATIRGECVALVDALDRLEVPSLVATGLDLDRFLWIRGQVQPHRSPSADANRCALGRALKAVTLVLQAGLYGLVVLDLAEAPPRLVRALPPATWVRLHRMIAGSRTACLLVHATPLWRSPRGLTVEMTAAPWTGGGDPTTPSHARLFTGLTLRPRLIRSPLPAHAPLCLPVSATCA